MNQPLLSVCIPTYNRIAYLRELLPILLREIVEANRIEPGRVELVVCDNASPDGTEAFCRDAGDSASYVYFRNAENVGGDANFLLCIERARGRYVWLFGDDELIEEGALTRVRDLLIQDSPALVVFDGNDALETRRYPDYRGCLRDEMIRQRMFPIMHSLITTNVFLKESFDMSLARAKSHTNYGHMFGLVSGLRKGGAVTVCPGVVLIRPTRAQFDQWPFALCVKQAYYLWHVARWFNIPKLRAIAVRAAANLPIEWAACLAHCFFPTRFGRT